MRDEDFENRRRTKKLCRIAVKLGATEARQIKTTDIVVREWVRLKCQYGCNGYGKGLTCPPYSPNPDEFSKIIADYNWAIILKFETSKPEYDWRSPHEVANKLEREAFLNGLYSSFGLASGPCPYCTECNMKKFINPTLARPSMEACGIDMYATVRKAGFSLKVAKDKDALPEYFGLLLVK